MRGKVCGGLGMKTGVEARDKVMRNPCRHENMSHTGVDNPKRRWRTARIRSNGHVKNRAADMTAVCVSLRIDSIPVLHIAYYNLIPFLKYNLLYYMSVLLRIELR